MDVLSLSIAETSCCGSFELCLPYIYERTIDNSQLLRFMVNLIAWKFGGTNFKVFPYLYHRDFLLDLANVYSTVVPLRTATNRTNRINSTDYYGDKR
jgi:hypothetical protein